MIKEQIENKLEKGLEPWHLEVINESPNHNVPDGAESHFKIVIVSEKFLDIRAVRRHQLIYSVLAEEMKKIHALSVKYNFKIKMLFQSPRTVKNM